MGQGCTHVKIEVQCNLHCHDYSKMETEHGGILIIRYPGHFRNSYRKVQHYILLQYFFVIYVNHPSVTVIISFDVNSRCLYKFRGHDFKAFLFQRMIYVSVINSIFQILL